MLEAWEKVIITGSNGQEFLASIHGDRDCQECHGGQEDGTFETMEEAHVDMIADPSATGACSTCHAVETAATANSLHTNLWGEITAIESRGNCTLAGGPYEDGFNQKCNSCHTTCGQCHISRPNSVGGGFPKIGSYYSHKFRATPDMNEQCTACHGSRVGVDFKGELEGNSPDLHRNMGWTCSNCHTKEEIHGDDQYEGDHYDHRYEVKTMPRCESTDCHPAPASNSYHDMHVDGFAPNLQCQVCHSQPYKNCTNCHNLVADSKLEKFDIDPSVIQLKIARNPSPHRTEYEFSLVRHTPVDPETFADWGLTLTDYLNAPTWQYTSPHNILRWTPQTTPPTGSNSCSISCHGAEDGPAGFLLRESDLYEADGTTPLVDYDANIGIVIPESFPAKK